MEWPPGMGGGGTAAGEVVYRGGRGDRVRVAELPMAEDSREKEKVGGGGVSFPVADQSTSSVLSSTI